MIARHKFRASNENSGTLIPGPKYKPKNVIATVFKKIQNSTPLSPSPPTPSSSATSVSPFNQLSLATSLSPSNQLSSATSLSSHSTEVLTPKCLYLNILFSNDLIFNESLINSTNEERFFNENVLKTPQESLRLQEKTINQGSSGYWKIQRRLRITASQCYSLFTYYKSKNEEKKNWAKKIESYVNPKFFFSKAVEYGKANEKFALCAYEKTCPNKITLLGLIVHPTMSWLGCSPDGFDEIRKILIEIKCPVAGSHLELDELLPTLAYLQLKDGRFCLKTNHQYYGQIQLSLFVLNISACDLVIYSEKANNVAIVEVKINTSFIKKLIISLKSVYQTHLLPYLVNNIINSV